MFIFMPQYAIKQIKKVKAYASTLFAGKYQNPAIFDKYSQIWLQPNFWLDLAGLGFQLNCSAHGLFTAKSNEISLK